MKEKKVSVIMCTYNGEKYLREQLDSIINQTYPIHELIIQDDNSTDRTLSILKEYQQLYSFIQIFENEKNLGVNQNFWLAFSHSTGDYISISDQDDIWISTKIEKMVKHIGNHLLIFSDSLLFRENNGKKIFFTHPTVNKMSLITLTSGIPGHACLFSPQLLSFISTSSKNLYIYDYCLALYAYQQNSITHLNQILTHHRRHETAVTNQGKKYSSLNGYYQGIKAYLTKDKQIKAQLFYSEMKQIFNHDSDKSIQKYLNFMSKPSLINMLRACLITYQKRKELKSNSNKLLVRLRTAFIPFFSYLHPQIQKKL